jgi:hypothetical protein
MEALFYHCPGKKGVEEWAKPEIEAPTDAVVKIGKTTFLRHRPYDTFARGRYARAQGNHRGLVCSDAWGAANRAVRTRPRRRPGHGFALAGPGTSNTGRLARRTTRSATLPGNRL